MRLIVFSDTHGDINQVKRIAEMHPEADKYIFLGDGEDTVKAFLSTQSRPFISVRGNCDFYSKTPYSTVFECEGKRIACTHGHLFGVKSSLVRIKEFALANKADILLFGHTHVAHEEYDDGLYILNPGSAARPRFGNPSYGIVDITPSGIAAFSAKIK